MLSCGEFPKDRAQDQDSCSSELLRECSQENGNKGSRISSEE